MVILEVYAKCLKNKYKTTLFSKATIFVVITQTFKIIVPFILAYRSGGFWLKHDTFYEQPNINFNGEYILSALTNNISEPIACSTFPEYHSKINDFDKCSTLKVREVDNNYDGIADELFFHVTIKTSPSTNVIAIALIITLDYKLQSTCHLQMQSAIILQQYINMPLSELNIKGDVTLNQVSPLHCHPKGYNRRYNYSIISNLHEINSYQTAEIIEGYAKRNISTYLTNVYTSIVQKRDSDFHLSLRVRYPEQQIYYLPGFWQMMKWAWIQYYAIYIICQWIVNKVEEYVFENRLVLFYKELCFKQN